MSKSKKEFGGSFRDVEFIDESNLVELILCNYCAERLSNAIVEALDSEVNVTKSDSLCVMECPLVSLKIVLPPLAKDSIE